MKEALNRLINHEKISEEEAKQVLINISKGDYSPEQIASFLTVYIMRSITVEELQGFKNALLELCVSVDFKNYNSIDLCGTGGDGKDTFNISTLSSFITAGSGVMVTKHGNYGVSSSCGSSNVLESLGVKFTNDIDYLKRSIETTNICILHAPLFHPAMKNVAPIRKALGVKTFFNILGPMVNPALPKYQLCLQLEFLILKFCDYTAIYIKNLIKNIVLYMTIGGYDELSLTNSAKIVSNKTEKIFNPEDLGLNPIDPSSIFGGNSIKKATEIFKSIIIWKRNK